MPRYGKRLGALQPSATVAIAAKAKALQSEGVDVLSFSLGEPDFDTPVHIRHAAQKAIDEGATRYTPARGTMALREAICEASFRRRGQRSVPAEVVVSCGAKHTLFNLAVALFDPGDEVVIPTPYWVSYPAQVKLCGAKPVFVETSASEHYLVSPEKLAAALSNKTKAVVLCTPSNPSGAAYSREQLTALIDVIRDHDCWLIVDEIYGELVYDGFECVSALSIAPELRDRIVVVDGVSKTYAMTGWRIGWMIGPEKLASECNKLQGQSTTNPAAVSQEAARAALLSPQGSVETMRAAFERRRDYIVDALNNIDGIHCPKPVGAFYAFPDVSSFIGRAAGDRVIHDDVELCDYLIDEARCAFVPGTAFGAPGHLRLSYAAAVSQLKEGITRTTRALAALS